MPGQFPVSSWLADKLNIPAGNAESILPSDRPMEPQIPHFDHCHLNPDWNVNPNLGSSSSPNFIDPNPGYLSPAPEVPNTQALEVRSEKTTPESPTQTVVVCSTCDISFPSQGKLNAHNRRHDKKRHCTQCGRRFSEMRDLHRHIQSVHQQLWDRCPQCGKRLKRRADNLRRHMTKYCKRK
ncbi:hypothetical protein M434DRAFT_395581 [Hypoxylon sp. CO27-5]|nr:hypothetical protein M434DRAFT_395581 [Hypoxylon sp. CO27-5]